MDPVTLDQLRKYLKSLSETELWSLLVEFFIAQGVMAVNVHGTGEHGIDVLAYVDPDNDFLHKGYNVLLQVKKGKLTLARWRNEVLGQIYEATYYPVPHHLYIDNHPRRVVLVLTGNLTGEARISIRAFNTRHEITLEVFELDDLIILFDETNYVSFILNKIRTVGVAIESEETEFTPPVVGQSFEKDADIE